MCELSFSTKTGPGEVIYIAIAAARRIGEKRIRRKIAAKISMALFAKS